MSNISTSNDINKCDVCGTNAEQKCSNCHLVSYCSRQHQKDAWHAHKLKCRPYKIETDPILGRCLVATRLIKSGEIIIKEEPLISGPPQLTAPICLGTCSKPIKPPFLRPCELCGWPLCGSESCKNSKTHEPECFYTRERGSKISITNFVFPHPNYQCIMALRMLYQKDNNPDLWQKLMKLQSHCEERKHTGKYESDRMTIAQFIHRFFKLADKFSEEEILKVCGIIQINGHEIPLTEPPYVAIYENTSMFEHNCRPNCCKSFSSNSEVLIHAAVDIKEGSHLTICYTDSLWGTLNRRHYLFETKYFACNCERCSDPTEFGTYFSALKCPNKECKGHVLPVTFLVDPSKDLESKWQCSVCEKTLTASAVERTIERIGHDMDAMKKGDPQSCQMFLDYYEKLLHPNHFYLTDVRLALAQLIGQETEQGLKATSQEDIDRKIQLCTKIITLIETLNPAEVRIRGTILFELHAAVAELARRKASSGESSPAEVQGLLAQSRDLLVDAVRLLQHEPNELPEGKICTQAKLNLEQINELLCTMHTQMGDSPI